MILNVNSGGGSSGEPELLWTNPNPTASFPAQTVAVDLTEYNAVIVKGRKSWTQPAVWYLYFSKDAISSGMYPIAAESPYSWWVVNSASVRFIDNITDSGIHFKLGEYADDSGTSPNTLIPTHIYGVKWEI